ncbi:alpha/beta hydrolase [Roseomonas sp. OT10]|uniref:alpha/beta hydrolase n=1 Tax=Roseomonas cutis TaxID=2897332 RepID=UPI001E58659D|nr:alpha/beta hydrolase [Roseomonas sp. OT10]UFN47209.1 alpha/beta hydrolase [Roseomonas sp. OT10]
MSTATSPGARLAAAAEVNDRIHGPGTDPWPERRTAFPGGVVGLPDLTYAVLPGYRPLKLDLYLPPETAAREGTGHPLVVYVHGGGWAGGSPRLSAAFASWPAVLAALAAEGVAVAALSYRFGEEAPFPAALDDLRTALAWLRREAQHFGIDAARIGLWGASAGGQIAAMAALTAAPEDDIQAVALWYGVFDFTGFRRPAPGSRELAYLGGGTVPATGDTLRAASPLFQVRALAAPFLLIHGEADQAVPVSQSVDFARALEDAGNIAELVTLPGIDHSFLGADPATTRETSRRMLARTVDFLLGTLGR